MAADDIEQLRNASRFHGIKSIGPPRRVDGKALGRGGSERTMCAMRPSRGSSSRGSKGAGGNPDVPPYGATALACARPCQPVCRASGVRLRERPSPFKVEAALRRSRRRVQRRSDHADRESRGARNDGHGRHLFYGAGQRHSSESCGCAGVWSPPDFRGIECRATSLRNLPAECSRLVLTGDVQLGKKTWRDERTIGADISIAGGGAKNRADQPGC